MEVFKTQKSKKTCCCRPEQQMEVKQRKHHHGGLMWISILELVIIFACSILLSVVWFRKLPSSMKTSSQTIKPKICFTCIILCSCKLQQQETVPSEICLNTEFYSYFWLLISKSQWEINPSVLQFMFLNIMIFPLGRDRVAHSIFLSWREMTCVSCLICKRCHAEIKMVFSSC